MIYTSIMSGVGNSKGSEALWNILYLIIYIIT